jgi:nitrate/TMAO reductase-like tetraheme cytochrome c subunit
MWRGRGDRPRRAEYTFAARVNSECLDIAMSTDDAQHAGDSAAAGDVPARDAATPRGRPARPRWRRVLRKGLLIGGVIVVLGVLGIGGAEYYTARPSFCGTCHIMDSYYQSWSQDVHGKKVGTWCVECHYAPGEQHTLKAKFRGLSQVASYFSGRYGTSRPRARVNDASCLRSACHGRQRVHAQAALDRRAARGENAWSAIRRRRSRACRRSHSCMKSTCRRS